MWFSPSHRKERVKRLSCENKANLLLADRSQTLVKADRAFIPLRLLPLHVDTTKVTRQAGDFQDKVLPQSCPTSLFSQVEAIQMQKGGSIPGSLPDTFLRIQ